MKKSFALILALVLVVGCVVGGTVAWLTATSDTVTNTFTTSDIKVQLKETKTNFKMIPGYTIEKDPKATVLAGSEECWLFVKLEKSTNFDSYLTYEMADGWFYYNAAVAPEEVTKPLFTTVHFDARMGNGYQSREFHVNVVAQAVQTANNGESALEANWWALAD